MATALICIAQVMTFPQRVRIQDAAANLMEARSEQAWFAAIGYLNGMPRIPTMVKLKAAENEFWRACHALLVDDSTGPRRKG